jgi:hypothetical protein
MDYLEAAADVPEIVVAVALRVQSADVRRFTRSRCL